VVRTEEILRKKLVLSNTIWLGLAQVTTLLLSPLLNVALARWGGAALFGEYAVAMSFVGIFSILTDLGLSGVVIRDVAADETSAGDYVGQLLPLRLTISVFGSVVLVVAMYVGHFAPTDRLATAAFALGLLFTSVSELFKATFRGLQRMQWDAVARTLERVLVLVFTVFVLTFGAKRISNLGGAYAAAQLAVLVSVIWTTQRMFFPIRLKISGAFFRRVLASSSMFFLAGLFWQLYSRVDRIILGNVRSTTEVGLYAAASSFITLAGLVPALVMQVMYPAISKAHGEGDEGLNAMIERLFFYLLVAAIPAVCALELFAGELTKLLYGGSFLLAGPLVKWLAFSVIFTFTSQLFTNVLPAIKMQRSWVILLAGGALVNVTMNLVLIPSYGAKGAAVAIVLTEAFVCLTMAAVLQRQRQITFSRSIIVVATATLAAVLLYLVLAPSAGLWSALPSTALYGAVLIQLDGRMQSDVRSFLRDIRPS
jgi:O-antigen/teichoic acid export membrane protein